MIPPETVEALKGRRRLRGADGAAKTLSLTNAELASVGRVIGHQVRLAIARDMCTSKRTSSLASWARKTRAELGTVAYHSRMLEQLEFASLEVIEDGPGTFQHLYGLRSPVGPAVRLTLDLLEGRVNLEPAAVAEHHDSLGSTTC
jgi:hypothetical protein